ncbi:MAG: RNA pyrophosphohydrolase [Rhodospirillales bacterium]|nr:RNA pyrophosphohydrolase [Rhodospirillales bacterium]
MGGKNTNKVPDLKNLPYRRGVGAVLFNGQGLVFVGRRFGKKYPLSWQMPQGGIDEGEVPEQAVYRELAEETGVEKAEVIAESKEWLTYDLPDELVGVAWGGKFRGQTQKWFALRFTGVDGDVDLNVHKKPEFRDWQWVAFKDLPDLIVPFKRRLYEEILLEFKDLPNRIADAS